VSDIVVKSISLHPIKSLDPVVVQAARVLASGALEHDREFALFDEQGNRINGKRDARIHRIRAHYDLPHFLVTLGETGGPPPKTFHLIDDQGELEDWFGNYFGSRVLVKRNTLTGFPDDLEAAGPTIVGSATIQEVGSWFGILDPVETSRRFRANIEVATESPFWEDCLFGEPGTPLTFRIGDATVHGVNPCQRCVVPSRNPSTGAPTPDFQRVFTAKRAQTLPAWVTQSHFNHYYRLTVNTRIPQSEAGKYVRSGDLVVR
jgi:uncharacterized protein